MSRSEDFTREVFSASVLMTHWRGCHTVIRLLGHGGSVVMLCGGLVSIVAFIVPP
jgi:hypothetical protein